MKYFLFLLFFIAISLKSLVAQTTLFDESRVSSVYIEISPDSLDVIMTDVLSEHYFKALFIYDYGSGRDTVQDVGFRLRGNTSRYSQKKSFKISFNEYVSGRKYQDVKKINLNGQHNDPTLIREKLFYDSWKMAGMPERRTSFVRLYINLVYYGLYTNLEEFDKDWLQRIYNNKNGNLYKCTYPADLAYLGTNQQTYKNIQSGAFTGGRAYELQTNETEDDYTDLVDLISTLNHTADTAFARLIVEKINVDGFLKAFAIDVATGNWDDYMYNKNNYFLYHRTDTGKFEFVSYDTDNTFGVDWVNRDWSTRNCLTWFEQNQPRPLAKKLLTIPSFMAKYKSYLDTVTREIFNPNVIFKHIDSLKNLVTEAAVADSFRTLDYGYTVADFNNGYIMTIDSHTPYGIKPFLTKRFTYTLQQLGTASIQEEDADSFSSKLYPNPAYGYIIDMLGRRLRTFILPGNLPEIVIPVTELLPGIYTLVLINNESNYSIRFVKR
jgi:spore coat protein H